MLKKIIEPFQEFGLGAGLLYATDRVLSMISPRLRLYVYELMVQPITTKPLIDGRIISQIEIREIRATDAQLALMPVRPEVMQSRMTQDTTCLGAFKKGALIGYMWFCRKTYNEDEVRCTYVLLPEQHSVFDFDFYLFPEHRMGLGFVALWSGANEYLRERGVHHTYSRLTRFNLASRRAHQHLGWKLVGRALFIQFFRVEVMMATLPPFVHVSLTSKDRVRMTLRPKALNQRG